MSASDRRPAWRGRGAGGTRPPDEPRARGGAPVPVDDWGDRDVTPRCRHAGACGGCDWQHVAYPNQLLRKRRAVVEALGTALGPAAPRVEAVAGMPAGDPAFGSGEVGPSTTGSPRLDPHAPWGFRQKAAFVFAPGPRGRGLVMGHYRRGSNLVVPVEECPVHAESANRVAFAVRDEMAAAGIPAASADLTRGVLRHLVVRASRASGETLATLVVTENDKALRAAVRRLVARPDAPDGLHLNVHDRPGPFLFGLETRHLHGRARLREEAGGVSFLVSPTAFFQTNLAAAEWLVGIVRDAVGPLATRVLDLYAGAGLFALPLAAGGHAVTAVEENRDAVEDGRASQRLSRIPESRCQFVAARVDAALGRLGGGGRGEAPFGVVVLDPPRGGCGPEVAAIVGRVIRPVRIVYVSCDPEALGRDLVAFQATGYRVDHVQPVDMFPHTPHVESVAVLRRCPGDSGDIPPTR